MNEICKVCGLEFREDERRSRYGGMMHELSSQCIGRLREENARLRAIVTPVTAHNEASTATPNQTYTWKPGDAWSEYTAAMDGDVVHVPILGTLDASTRIPQP